MSTNTSRARIPLDPNADDPDRAADTGWHGSAQLARRQHHRSPVHLTRRELEVLTLLCTALPNKLIARQLNISGGTVKTHVANVLRELGVSSRLQAVVRARQWGLVENAPEVMETRQSDRAGRAR